MKMLMHHKVFPNGLMKEAVAIDLNDPQSQVYDNVLGGFLWGASGSPDYWREVLATIDMIGQRGGSAEETISYNDWYVTIRPLNIEIDNAADDQSMAVFPASYVRNAVIGWIQFLQMPETESSQLIVELDQD